VAKESESLSYVANVVWRKMIFYVQANGFTKRGVIHLASFSKSHTNNFK